MPNKNVPPVAPILFIMCGDHRTTRSRDVAIIEEQLDRIAAMYELVPEGEPVEFDEIRTPGPHRGIVQGSEAEQSTLIVWLRLFERLHGVKLVVLGVHVGIGEEPGCAREGEENHNPQILMACARAAIGILQRWFPHMKFEILIVEVEKGRTVRARLYDPQ